ncbi:hypothetical protein MARBORIA2_18010 [Methanobrevibacter arboriphilus]|uniref:Uncharacterized protein n=1 Tax=Methanobrevibacter arboriphilus TaxID=39441 RepID=A0ACA8R496_METAZ|nr:hypothetical protein MarbSA_07350 [Methanobrevibacter arboriphilus]GLI12711.1 hypothetical protein MARBORIA2_18010 [Methanobrevibacter arboriphilus]
MESRRTLFIYNLKFVFKFKKFFIFYILNKYCIVNLEIMICIIILLKLVI